MREEDILHEAGPFWVSNEGTKDKPSYHVWVDGSTHSVADSAYRNLSLAISRADYLHRTHPNKLDAHRLHKAITKNNSKT